MEIKKKSQNVFKKSTTLTILAILTIYLSSFNNLSAKSENFPKIFRDLKPGPYNIGFSIKHTYDYSRTFKNGSNSKGISTQKKKFRPIQILVWYPAKKIKNPKYMQYKNYIYSRATLLDFNTPESSKKQLALKESKEMVFNKNIPGKREESIYKRILEKKVFAIRDAEPKPLSCPLIIVAPGSHTVSYVNAALCEYLASYGYIVASNPSLGHFTKSMTMDFIGLEAQTRDLEFVISKMRTYPNVDYSKIAIVGYSWSGLANVICAMRNTNINAIVSLDGSIVMANRQNLLKILPYYNPNSFDIPVMLFYAGLYGEKSPHDFSFYNSLKYSDAYLIQLKHLRHWHFGSNNIFLYMDTSFDKYAEGKKKVKIGYATMCKYTLNFLNAYLKKDNNAFTFLNNTIESNKIPSGTITIKSKKSKSKPLVN